MLEAAVCQKLQAVLFSSDNGSTPQQQQQPLVFGLITNQLDHSGATISLQHKFFAYRPDSTWQYSLEQYRPSSTFASYGGSTSSISTRAKIVHHPHLQPLALRVVNLGQPDMQRPITAAAAAGSSTGGALGTAGLSQYGGRQGVQQLAAVAAALDGSGAGDALKQQLLMAAEQVGCDQGGKGPWGFDV
jgi:hypothetical protein